MDNKIEHFFVLKPDGKIYHIPDYPESFYYANDPVGWKRAVQYAIDNAVEVSNQEEVRGWIFDTITKNEYSEKWWKVGQVYSLQCSVEGFSQPEREETQEEDLETAHWVRIINDSRFYDGSPHDLINLIAHFKKLGFTLTRKTP